MVSLSSEATKDENVVRFFTRTKNAKSLISAIMNCAEAGKASLGMEAKTVNAYIDRTHGKGYALKSQKLWHQAKNGRVR